MGASDIVIEVGQSLQLLGNNAHEGNIRVAGCLWLPRAVSDFTNLLKLKPGAQSGSFVTLHILAQFLLLQDGSVCIKH